MNVEDHLGVTTGALDGEQMSLSGNHNDIVDGTFNMQFTTNSKALNRDNVFPGQ